jgi:hypothetical protein
MLYPRYSQVRENMLCKKNRVPAVLAIMIMALVDVLSALYSWYARMPVVPIALHVY